MTELSKAQAMTTNHSPIWHPFTQHGLGDPIPLIARGEGARLYDADGNHWIDAISSWWVTTHGHAHPRIMAAIREQSERLDQLIFAGWTHEPAESLAAEANPLAPMALKQLLAEAEATLIAQALAASNGTIAESARLLGLKRTTLVEKL